MGRMTAQSSKGSARRRLLSSSVWIQKQTSIYGHRAGAFEACVRIGKLSRFLTTAKHYGKNVAKGGFTCAMGKNPRTALANALTAAARRFRKRGGAFAGCSYNGCK